MPIVKLRQDNTHTYKPNLPKIQPKDYKGINVDAREIPRNKLLSYIEGSPWTVEYFSQVLGNDSDLKEFDIEQDKLYQQYIKYNKLEIRVDSPIDSNIDQDNSLTTIEGSANIYPPLIPNVGDAFIADVGLGRVGLYSVTQVERKTFNRESVYSINYTCIAFEDVEPEKFKNIRNKVIREYYFNKDRLIDGGLPVLTKTEDEEYTYLKNIEPELIEYYYNNFFEKDIGAYCVPKAPKYTYDHFINVFISKLVDNANIEFTLYSTIKNIENDQYLKQHQIYSVLLKRDHTLLSRCNRYMGVCTTNSFSWDSTLQSLRYSKVAYIVYPMSPDTTSLQTSVNRVRQAHFTTFKELSSPSTSLEALISDSDLTKDFNLIKPINIDKAYVFSDEFYNGSKDMSVLEEVTYTYLKREAPNISKIVNLCKSYRNWGRLEQFFYIPVLLIVVRAAKREVY